MDIGDVTDPDLDGDFQTLLEARLVRICWNLCHLGHSLKLVKVRCTRDSRRHFFSNRVIKRWNQLGQEAVDATNINAFKSKLDRLRYTRMGFFMDQSA